MSLEHNDQTNGCHRHPTPECRESDDRRRGARDSPSLMMLVLVATIGVLLYTTFLFDFSNRGNWIPYLMVLTAESVIIVQALIALWTILSSGHNPRGYRFHNAQNRLYGPQITRHIEPEHRPDPAADAPARERGGAGRLHHHLRRGPRHDPPDGHRRCGDARPAHHLRPRRRQVRRRPRAGRRAGRRVHRPGGQRRRQGRQHQQRAVASPPASTSSSWTRTSCRSRISCTRPCRSSRRTTWRSCRPRRPTETCTT